MSINLGMKRGAYVLIVGPTGSGKNTLISAAREAIPGLAFAVSATTRPMRPGEVDGVNYHFLSREVFQQKVADGAFLEWAEYGGNLYGTLRSEVEPAIAAGTFILSDIEIQGVEQILASDLAPQERVTIYIDAGSWDELVARITARGPMNSEDLERRRVHFAAEEAFKHRADYVVHNHAGKLAEAQEAFIGTIQQIMRDRA